MTILPRMSQLSVTMPENLQSWIKSRLAGGDYADEGDYLRELVRRDQADASEERRWLKAMIDEGIASGVLERDADEVFAEIIAEDPDLRG